MDWYLLNSEETHSKYVAKFKNIVKENIKEKEEYMKRVLKGKLKAREAMATSWTVWEGHQSHQNKRIMGLVDKRQTEAQDSKPTDSCPRTSPEY